MSVQSEIDRIITAVGNAYNNVSEKGGTLPASQTVANLATAIDSIPSGVGDMLAATYDPQGKAQDIYAYTDNTVNAAKPKSVTVTLTTSGWAQSGSRYAQTVNVTGVTASTPVVLVDVALSGADIDADAAALEAWGIVSANNVAQGNGTLTFYSLSVPSVNIPVNVGVC